jgi:hypothetical protein
MLCSWDSDIRPVKLDSPVAGLVLQPLSATATTAIKAR